MSEIMTTNFGKKFDELRAKYVKSAEDIEHYEQTVRSVVLIRKLLIAIDAERQRAGLSKAELARRIGADPSVVRRLFSKKASNPTLRTILDMLSALNIDVELKPGPAQRSLALEPRTAGSNTRRRLARSGGA
ncbi:MAG: helix-turn-helix transcriptional regulator [Chloroflexi bacterium]|nr:helix-turn-helix transcriptional regulator [Chloroflexota bacterium]